MLVMEILSWLLALAFLVIGGTKLISLKFQQDAFDTLGYPQWMRLAVGGVEVGAAALLVVPGLRVVGAAAVVVVTSGAMHAHVFREKAPAHAIPPGVLGAVAAVVAAAGTAGLMNG